MFELKTLVRKAEHPLFTLPEVSAAREPNQRRMMAVALVLLLVALGVVLYRDRDFWFPDAPEAEDQLEPAPSTVSTAAQPTPAAPKALAAEQAPEKPWKKMFSAKAKSKIPAPVAPAVTTAAPEPPAAAATTSRTVLPSLEVEVVAGDNHRTIHPGSTSVHVDLQPGSAPRTVANAPATSAPVDSTPVAGNTTTNAAERVQMSAGSAEVVGQPAKPGYPMLARQMKVQGSVILQALIGRDGAIQNLHVVSGPPILAGAAEQAVRQWRFKPHYLGNEAVETQANITVNFTISTN
jgi:TonB family protein